MKIQQPIYKVISILLDYPNKDLFNQFLEMKEIISYSELSEKVKIDIVHLIDTMASKALLDLEEEYVEIFENSRSNSLYLFEHLYSDSKQRGTAMLELKKIYKSAGLVSDASELPDYIPMFLEYLSALSKEKAESLLDESINIFGVLEARFIQKNIIFKCLFSALLELATKKPSSNYIKNVINNIKDTPIDEEWLEPEAFPTQQSKNNYNYNVSKSFVNSSIGAK